MSNKAELKFGNGWFAYALTLVFVVMKCLGYLDWTWVEVFLPLIIVYSMTFLIILVVIFATILKNN